MAHTNSDIAMRVLQALPTGYSEVCYRGARYGMTVTHFNRGRSVKLYAEELQGTDIVSLNYYRLTSRQYLRPCEMPVEKVTEFLLELEPLAPRSPASPR